GSRRGRALAAAPGPRRRLTRLPPSTRVPRTRVVASVGERGRGTTPHGGSWTFVGLASGNSYYRTMSNPIAGWYPDPSGDTSKLRYWDGTSWTDHLAPAQGAEAAAQASGDGGRPAEQMPAEQPTTQLPSQSEQPTTQLPSQSEQPTSSYPTQTYGQQGYPQQVQPDQGQPTSFAQGP